MKNKSRLLLTKKLLWFILVYEVFFIKMFFNIVKNKKQRRFEMKKWCMDAWSWAKSGWKLFKKLIIFIILLVLFLLFWHFYLLKTIISAVNAQQQVVFIEQPQVKEQVKPKILASVSKKVAKSTTSAVQTENIDELEYNCLIVYNNDKKDRYVWLNGIKEKVSPGRRKFNGSPSGNTAVWTKENKVVPFNLNSYDRKVKIMYIKDGVIS